MKTGITTKILSALLVLAFSVSWMAFPAMAKEASWEENVLAEDVLDLFGLDREDIVGVEFFDDLDQAPRWVWHVDSSGKDRVQCWMRWEDNGAVLCFGADGGINGKLSTKNMFAGCVNLRYVRFNGAFHTEQAESMRNMFYGCVSLEELDAQTLETGNVTSMFQMFRNCRSLKELDVSGFDTGKTQSMYCMFANCVQLEQLDVSGFDTAKVTNMGYMFSNCQQLESLDVADWDTGEVYNLEGTFRWCASLKTPDISGWNLSSVKYYDHCLEDGATVNGTAWLDIFR